MSICAQIKKKSEFDPRGGEHFSNNSEIQKILNYPGGGEGVHGAGLIGNFSHFFLYFNYDASKVSLFFHCV